MRVRIGNELLPLNLLSILLIAAIIFFPSNILRLILGIPFMLFLPGYALVAALFPERIKLSGVERIALSLGLSLVVVSLAGLIFNYTPWGITLASTLSSLACFTLIMSVIAWLRRRRLPNEERFGIKFYLALGNWEPGIQNKALSIILVLAVLGALGMMGYAIAKPKIEQKFTEFYILGLEGKATDYPKELKVEEEGIVTIGIVNHEYEATSYRVEVRINGDKNNEAGPIVLENDEKWIQEVSFVPQVAGEKQKVEFFLYKNGEPKPYLEPLRLWIDVTE